MNKASKEYRALAAEYGFVLVRVKKHMVFKHPTGPVISCPATPSDAWRGLKQFRKDIKRAINSESRH